MCPDRRQLLLPLPDLPGFDARDFIPAASNRDALAWLEAPWPERRLAIWGPPGSGKSHLLHLWAEREGGMLLRGTDLRDPTILPAGGAAAIDDADLVAPETLLLHTLNVARDRSLRLLLSARQPPARWTVRLPDLASRLRALPSVGLRPPDDELLGALLMRLLAERQLSVAPSLQAWLLHRLPRTAEALREAVAILDRESLLTGRPISRGMASHVLARTALPRPAMYDDWTDGDDWGSPPARASAYSSAQDGP